jgi:hypothetical protein
VTLIALKGANTILLRALMSNLVKLIDESREHSQLKNVFTLDSAQNAYNNQGAY